MGTDRKWETSTAQKLFEEEFGEPLRDLLPQFTSGGWVNLGPATVRCHLCAGPLHLVAVLRADPVRIAAGCRTCLTVLGAEQLPPASRDRVIQAATAKLKGHPGRPGSLRRWASSGAVTPKGPAQLPAAGKNGEARDHVRLSDRQVLTYWIECHGGLTQQAKQKFLASPELRDLAQRPAWILHEAIKRHRAAADIAATAHKLHRQRDPRAPGRVRVPAQPPARSSRKPHPQPPIVKTGKAQPRVCRTCMQVRANHEFIDSDVKDCLICRPGEVSPKKRIYTISGGLPGLGKRN